MPWKYLYNTMNEVNKMPQTHIQKELIFSLFNKYEHELYANYNHNKLIQFFTENSGKLIFLLITYFNGNTKQYIVENTDFTNNSVQQFYVFDKFNDRDLLNIFTTHINSIRNYNNNQILEIDALNGVYYLINSGISIPEGSITLPDNFDMEHINDTINWGITESERISLYSSVFDVREDVFYNIVKPFDIYQNQQLIIKNKTRQILKVWFNLDFDEKNPEELSKYTPYALYVYPNEELSMTINTSFISNIKFVSERNGNVIINQIRINYPPRQLPTTYRSGGLCSPS